MPGKGFAEAWPRVGRTLPGPADCAINGAAANAAVPAAATERKWRRAFTATPVSAGEAHTLAERRCRACLCGVNAVATPLRSFRLRLAQPGRAPAARSSVSIWR
ncbi:hypothetical protein F9K92_04585 [Stenotrophomonas rhizophila]|uniref:Uncharacterized protein n=1 Tax=Stenotrophomonas rhizophila TaxID=216778 RepID=A0A7V7YIW7_9GAMM|nr:hypothetical protein F9K92_04585 [Stenotrophomonas rhizophila]